MTSRDVDPARVIADVANALQTAVLLVEHLERTTAAVGRDVAAIRVSLDRAARVLQTGEGRS
jgi:hypothetical protein